MKRKFREALERKRGQQAGSGGSGRGADHSKIHGAHGPAAEQAVLQAQERRLNLGVKGGTACRTPFFSR
ncbi:DUF5302 domain-containing protein [Nonomuraea ferruginea]